MNLPNKLTILRTIMIPFFLVFLYMSVMEGHDFGWFKWVALGVFIAASLTDMLDGKIARKYNLVTNFGKFLQERRADPGAGAGGLPQGRRAPAAGDAGSARHRRSRKDHRDPAGGGRRDRPPFQTARHPGGGDPQGAQPGRHRRRRDQPEGAALPA